jgi:hypothetical protein
MKFLIFNVVVAAALVFLFAGEKGEINNVAQKADKKIAELKKSVSGLIEEQNQDIPSLKKLSEPIAAPAQPPSPAQQDVAKPTKPPSKPREPGPQKATTQDDMTPETSYSLSQKTNSSPVSSLPKEVVKRRNEVLGDSEEAPKVVKNSFMTLKARKRELLFLAEEMEILAAKLSNE